MISDNRANPEFVPKAREVDRRLSDPGSTGRSLRRAGAMALRSQSIASPGRELPEDPPKSRIYTNNEGSYELGAKLGSGAVADVYEGKLLPDRRLVVAIKVFYAGDTNEEDTDDRTKALREMRHEFDLFAGYRKYFESLPKPKPSQHVIKLLTGSIDASSTGPLFLVFEKAEYDLDAAIQKNVVNSKNLLSIIYQLLIGVSDLHRAKIVHRDIHKGNVLLVREELVGGVVGYSVKIIDLGWGEIVGQRAVPVDNPSLLSPELLEANVGVELPVRTCLDMWQVGLVIIQCVYKDFGTATIHKKEEGDTEKLPAHLTSRCFLRDHFTPLTWYPDFQTGHVVFRDMLTEFIKSKHRHDWVARLPHTSKDLGLSDVQFRDLEVFRRSRRGDFGKFYEVDPRYWFYWVFLSLLDPPLDPPLQEFLPLLDGLLKSNPDERLTSKKALVLYEELYQKQCAKPGVPEIASIRDHFALHSLAAYRARRHYVSRDTSENLRF